MTLLFIWVLFSIIVGVYAENHRNRNGLGWFLISIVTSPLLGFLLCAAMRPLPNKRVW